MNTIKINQLATSNIALTDFFAKADANGVASKSAIQELSNLLKTVDDTEFKGSIAIADVPSGNGWYFASESGTYTNCGGLVINTSNNISIIIISGTFDVFNKIDIPVNITIDTTVIDGSANAVSGNAVFDAINDLNITFDAAPVLDSENAVWSGGVYPLKKDLEDIAINGKSYVDFNSFNYIDGSYINHSDGSIVSNALWRYIELSVDDYELTTTINGGYVVALISYFDADNNYLGYQEKGQSSGDQVFTDLKMIIPTGTSIIRVCVNIDKIISLKVKEWDVANQAEVDKNTADILVINNNLVDPNTVAQNTSDIDLINQESKDNLPFTNFVYGDGFFILASNGTKTANSSWRVVELSVDNYILTVDISGGSAIALIAYYDVSDNYLGYQELGSPSAGVTDSYVDLEMILPNGTTKIIVSTNIDEEISLKLNSYDIATKTWVNNLSDIVKVQTWGDSITAINLYQVGIASELGIETSDVKNFGLASDYSQHIRNRFVSYFTDEVPYRGTATYNVPSLIDRQAELEESFFVFWIGTNNLLNINDVDGYKKMYASAYRDQMFRDISIITRMLPNSNFAIIGGHGGYSTNSDIKQIMDDFDNELVRMYPRNVIDIKSLFSMDYDYLNTFIDADFIKPIVGGTVDINLTDVSWIGDSNKNNSSEICIGTKDVYDKYSVDSLLGNIASCTLLEDNTGIATGSTFLKEYSLVSDLNRDTVTMFTQVFSYEDCLYFSLGSLPRSATDPIHFLNVDLYARAGELIGKEMKKIK